MTETDIRATIHGGCVGVAGAQNVYIANLNLGVSALPALPSRTDENAAIPPCPYPGLAYFGPQDSALFFGRDAAISRLEAAVARQTLTALVGASGTGKSSVVLAGLAPRLHARGGWQFSHFRVGTEPNKNPFFALARALVPLLGEHTTTGRLEEVEKLAVKLVNGAVTLSNVLGECRRLNSGNRILLIADQFEEVFTLVDEEVLRDSFIDTLLTGFADRADHALPDICLILTLRADFYGMALRYRPLADALQGRVENLGPMTREELHEAIVRPAGVVTFETDLVDTMLDDVARQPGSLPLLQFALREMWARLNDRRMTRAAYGAIGGVEGALAQRAQEIFKTITNSGGDTRAVTLFRQLFTRLISLGDGAEDTRRVVGRKELGKEAWALAQQLAGETNRLVVTSAPAADHETVELTHEALIRNWPTFVEWVSADRGFLSWLAQLKPRINDWRRHPDDDGTLLRGGPLRVAEEWLQRRHDEISDEERAYIAAGRELREALRRRDEEARAREQNHTFEIRVARTRTQRMFALVGVLIMAMIMGVVAWWKGSWLNERSYAFVHADSLAPVRERALTPGTSFKECTDCPEMVIVPAGSITMGSLDFPNEQPPHEITITQPFAVARFETTFEEWDACVTHGDCASDITDQGWGRGRQPVINVSWRDVKQYVAWLGRITGKDYGLLTEAQWEYAGRAGQPTHFSFGNDDAQLDQYAWFALDADRRPHPVGEKKSNALGLYDMHGNVSEWVEDCYSDNYRNAPSDGSAWNSGSCVRRVIRGGSWLQRARMLRSASRDWLDVDKRSYDTGFRVGRSLGR
jgi:formylglycine-generating enzyme required for sulfatase activity